MTESLGSLYLYAHLDPCLCEHNSIVKISSSCTILTLSYQQLSHCMEKKEAYPSTPSHCEAGSCFKYSAKISHYQFYSSGLHTHIFTGFLLIFQKSLVFVYLILILKCYSGLLATVFIKSPLKA